MGFSIIVAHDEERGIGKNNAMAWRIKEDLAHFKRITIDGVVIMGRKTWESLPKAVRPFPSRENVIVSRSFKAPGSSTESPAEDNKPSLKSDDYSHESVHFEASLEDAIEKWTKKKDKHVLVIGGGSIYSQAIKSPKCESLIITKVQGTHGCDTFFPKYENEWEMVKELEKGENYSIGVWERKKIKT